MANLPHLAASPLFLALLDATVNPAVLHEPHLGVGVSLAALTPPSGVPGLGLWGFGLVALGVLSVGGGLTGTRLAATAAALLISSAPLGGEGVLGL